MKNTRTAAAVAVALTGALALSACTPPHQKDSANYVDTATTGPSSPSIDPSKGPAKESSAVSTSEARSTAANSTEANSTEANSTEANSTESSSAESALSGVEDTAQTAGSAVTEGAQSLSGQVAQ